MFSVGLFTMLSLGVTGWTLFEIFRGRYLLFREGINGQELRFTLLINGIYFNGTIMSLAHWLLSTVPFLFLKSA